MGHRLSKIVTRTGDQGETGLGDGSRVPKDCLRVEALGSVDELNSVIGLLLCESLSASLVHQLSEIQHDLFDIGGELSIPGRNMMTADKITQLECQLETLNDTLTDLKEFILPGGSRASALCHLARTVCRRVERCVIRLQRDEVVNQHTLVYLNRLSDYLFVVARYVNKVQNISDVLWQSEHSNKK